MKNNIKDNIHLEIGQIISQNLNNNVDVGIGTDIYDYKGKPTECIWLRADYDLDLANYELISKFRRVISSTILNEIKEIVTVVDFQFHNDICMIVFIAKEPLIESKHPETNSNRFKMILNDL